MLEHEPKLEEQVANVYAARFSADELRAAGAFYRTTTGTLYATFNRGIAANPYVTPEIVRAEIAKRFTTQQRGDVFTYLSGGVGKKMIGILPDLLKAGKEVTEQWGAAPKKTSTARSVPAKKSPDLGVMRKRSPAGNLPAGRSFFFC